MGVVASNPQVVQESTVQKTSCMKTKENKTKNQKNDGEGIRTGLGGGQTGEKGWQEESMEGHPPPHPLDLGLETVEKRRETGPSSGASGQEHWSQGQEAGPLPTQASAPPL